MDLKLFVSALFSAAFSLAASVAVAGPMETKFGGFPSYVSQHGLAELQPGLFVSDNLDRETGCLAAAIYFEARGESRLGQIAVAQVIVNRKRSAAYPDTICAVVWQNAHKRNACQFSFTCDGKADVVREDAAWKKARMLAIATLCKRKCNYMATTGRPELELDDYARRATHYHADFVSPSWGAKLQRMAQIGRHIFYVSPRVERSIRAGA